MSADFVYGQLHLAWPKRLRHPTPPVEQCAVPASGRIIALLVGQGTGFIRLGTDGKVFFHRTDVQPGTSINDLELGDVVEFDLVEDRVSGARALRVRRPAAG